MLTERGKKTNQLPDLTNCPSIDADPSTHEAIKKVSASVENHLNTSTMTAFNTLHMTSATQSDELMNDTETYTATATNNQHEGTGSNLVDDE